MARGNDERHNPNRRPQRPQTDEEKMAIVKQVFPNAREVNTDYEKADSYVPTPEDEAEALRMEQEGSAEYSDMADSYYRTAESDAEKEAFGDDYNAYKAHKAGDLY